MSDDSRHEPRFVCPFCAKDSALLGLKSCTADPTHILMMVCPLCFGPKSPMRPPLGSFDVLRSRILTLLLFDFVFFFALAIFLSMCWLVNSIFRHTGLISKVDPAQAKNLHHQTLPRIRPRMSLKRSDSCRLAPGWWLTTWARAPDSSAGRVSGKAAGAPR